MILIKIGKTDDTCNASGFVLDKFRTEQMTVFLYNDLLAQPVTETVNKFINAFDIGAYRICNLLNPEQSTPKDIAVLFRRSDGNIVGVHLFQFPQSLVVIVVFRLQLTQSLIDAVLWMYCVLCIVGFLISVNKYIVTVYGNRCLSISNLSIFSINRNVAYHIPGNLFHRLA